jgi:hypothetical protein
MNKSEQEKRIQGLRQSTSDPRTYFNNDGKKLTVLSENRTLINNKIVFGSGDVEKEKKKWKT